MFFYYRDWAAFVMFSMQWKELNVNAQISNTMGNTVWFAQQGTFRGHLQVFFVNILNLYKNIFS